MRGPDPAAFARVDIAVPDIAGADQPPHGDQRYDRRLQVGAGEAAGAKRRDSQGRGSRGGRQGGRPHEADIAVPARLAPGPAVAGLQHIEVLAEQQLVLLLGALLGGLQDPGRRTDAAHLGDLREAIGAHQPFEPAVGEIRPRQEGPAIGHPTRRRIRS